MFLEKLPAIGVHLQSLAAENIVGAIMSSQWLLTLFVNVLSHHVAMRLWDLLFEFRSRRVLFGACLALVEPREEDLLSTTEMGECIELLQSLGSQVSDAEAFASRVRHWVEQELTEEWLAECKRWQQVISYHPFAFVCVVVVVVVGEILLLLVNGVLLLLQQSERLFFPSSFL